jgi:hypothetical protein
MTPALLLRLTVNPTLSWLEELGVRSDDRARVMLLAIAGQETGFTARVQANNGPAHSFWQGEKGGGMVAGCLTHERLRPLMLGICKDLVVPPNTGDVWQAITWNDHLACAAARLLLWSDPLPLPAVDRPELGWAYYLRTWRPGKPHSERWAKHWSAAVAAVAGASFSTNTVGRAIAPGIT